MEAGWYITGAKQEKGCLRVGRDNVGERKYPDIERGLCVAAGIEPAVIFPNYLN